MMRRSWLFAVLTLCCFNAPATAADNASDRMFDRLKGLVGEWEGTFQWSDGRSGSGPLRVVYSTTGNGSALVEDLIQGGERTMTSVYHLDGPDLRMTHYCGARTQPRFKAKRIDEGAGKVEFGFVDVTNANPKKPAYVTAASLQIVDPDQLLIRFTFGGSPDVKGVENISVKRVGAKDGAHS